VTSIKLLNTIRVLTKLDSSSIDLPGSEIATIDFADEILCIQFSKAFIIRTMAGSIERTRWWQRGKLIFTNAEMLSAFHTGSPLICTGGDVTENLYTFRDMIPIPFAGRGQIRCVLRFKDQDQTLQAIAQGVRLEMEDVAKYIEHIRDHK